MKFLLAFDSYKESMSALDACTAAKQGILEVLPNATCISVPLGDGGEGSMDALVSARQGKKIEVKVVDAMGDAIVAKIGVIDEEIAVIEMAQACGLEKITKVQRNPWIASSYGCGLLFLEAMNQGYRKFIFCLGGSATNDIGIGFLQALGVVFKNQHNQPIQANMDRWEQLQVMDMEGLDTRLQACTIEIASDVKNKLLGKQGATYVFGQQKGLKKKELKTMEQACRHIAELLEDSFHQNCKDKSGSGAAGGLGMALQCLGASVYEGIEVIAKHTKLEEQMKECNFVFTGEGSVDFQTKYGKTPIGVAKLAQKYEIPTIVFAGKKKVITKELEPYGVTAVFSIMQSLTSLEQALQDGVVNLKETVINVVRLLQQ